ncbi:MULTISPECIES: fimbrial protein [Providencia]|uniref:fimbrial protein n=1 Tax=Providencia TaxID=586 RepID=UPI002AA0CD91|nr:fimbrial protein [Providencia stuartii]
MFIQSSKNRVLGLLGGVALLALSTAQAVEVNFSGNLIENPPCDVAGPDGPNQPIKIDFGEVGITKIDGVNYQQDFTLTLTCGPELGNEVPLFLQYMSPLIASYDNKALRTNVTGLGIRLYHNGAVIGPGTGSAMKMSSNGTATLPLYAVPVRDPNPSVVLREGPFTASATVQMLYP